MSGDIEHTNESEICGLCNKNKSKYCCPRCEVLYCSLDCYKSEKHMQCSESFYRECVNDELASNEVDDEAKQKMVEILKRMQNGDVNLQDLEDVDGDLNLEDSDDDSDLDLHSRIKDLNLNDPDAIWNALTNDERNEFEALVNGGDVGSILPLWDPWWMYRKGKQLVAEVKDADNDKYKEKCPALKNVPEFQSLTSVKPSPSISFNISNILASYAFIMRYFNGEVDPVEGVSCLLDICGNLNVNTNFEEMDIAIEAVAQNCLQSELIETDKESLDIMKEDVLRLLQGPCEDNKLYYSRAALSDLIQLLTDSKSKLKVEKEKNTDGEFTKRYPDQRPFNLDKSKINKAIKKLEYYLSFLNSCDT
ncbi:zinc finger HIT domain-containing protein 2 [Aricia agestis]|uniref:zinc finger HIT domain-containing protein 2 n=1 Tax=Aricia agestis TaxID=91739 RepID=UPI001C205376|nr:zinc finger HIT domain-containing protein 2 [Aricia agestis]